MTSRQKRNTLCGFILLVVTLLVYLPSSRGAFLWDDDAHVSQNTALTTSEGLRHIWLRPGSVQQYYPVTYTVFWLQYHLWGLHTTGYHLVNVLIHVANALLVWAILSTLGVPGAWIAAWLFALHPVEVESVAWISELKNTLSGFFYLASTLFLVKTADDRAIRWKWELLSLALFAAAVLSKSVTCTLPVSYLLISTWMNGRADPRTIRRLLPFVVVGSVVGLFTLHMEHDVIGALSKVCDFNALQRFVLAGRCVWFYLWKLIYPAPLLFIYPRWTISSTQLSGYLYPLSGVGLAVILAFGKRWWGKGPLACYLFFVVTLGPALGFTNFYPMRFSFVADHFQYLASIGLFTLVGWALAHSFEALTIPLPSAGSILLLSFLFLNMGLATARQCRYYQSPEKLWQHTLDYNQDSAIAHHNLGIALTQSHQWNLAVAHLRTAEALDPSYPQTHLALAFLASQASRWDDARHHYNEAFRLGVTDPQVIADFSKLPPAKAPAPR